MPIPGLLASSVLAILEATDRLAQRVTSALEARIHRHETVGTQPPVPSSRPTLEHGRGIGRAPSPSSTLRTECFDRMVAHYVAN